MTEQKTVDYEHLLSLPEGLELRGALAEKMGWQIKEIETLTVPGIRWYRVERPGVAPANWNMYDLEDYLPPFDTSVDAALTMIDLAPCDFELRSPAKTFWTAYLHDGGVWIQGDADTPALAICRAMLRYWQAQEAT